MVCHALGRCRICGKKHKLPIYGGQENHHVFIEKIHLQLIVLNSICLDCIVKFEKFVKNNDEIAFAKKNSSEGEIIKHYQTLGNVSTNKTELHPKTEFCVENNERTSEMEITRKNKNKLESEEKFMEKTTKHVGNKRKSTPEVELELPIVEDHAPKKSRIPRATKSARCTMFCNFCSKEFTHRGDMKRHKRKHTGERPYGCTLCPKKFSQLSNLRRHCLVHSGERPFSCEKCGQSYSRKERLTNHIIRDLCKRTIRQTRNNLKQSLR